MSQNSLPCPKCRLALPEANFNTGQPERCPSCRTKLQSEVFPAYRAGLRIGRPGEPLVDASEASCFFHAGKRAAVACESCGRFLCSLCDLEMNGRHICPSCFSSTRKKGGMKELDAYRISWPGMGLLLGLMPFAGLYMFTPFTALGSLILLAVGLKKPGSITGRKRIFLYLFTFVLAVAELVGSVMLGQQLLDGFTKNGLR